MVVNKFKGINHVTPFVVFKWLQDDEAILVDVREEEEWNEERIDGAILSPMSDFEADKFPTNPNKRLVIMCRVGQRSYAIAEKMVEFGIYPVYNMNGGILRWRTFKLPVKSGKYE